MTSVGDLVGKRFRYLEIIITRQSGAFLAV